MPDRELSSAELQALIHESHSTQRTSYSAIFLEEKSKPSLHDMVLSECLSRLDAQKEIIAQLAVALDKTRRSMNLPGLELKTPALWKNEMAAIDREIRTKLSADRKRSSEST